MGIPGTESEEHPQGFMVEVYWEQDDSGALCIAGHSQKVGVPPSVQVNSSATTNRRSSGRAGSVRGVVIDPTQVGTVNFLR